MCLSYIAGFAVSIPQAGVSIGLAALSQRILPGDIGMLVSTVILFSGILYEIVGPACAKLSLFLSHAIPEGAAAKGQKQKKAAPPLPDTIEEDGNDDD